MLHTVGNLRTPHCSANRAFRQNCASSWAILLHSLLAAPNSTFGSPSASSRISFRIKQIGDLETLLLSWSITDLQSDSTITSWFAHSAARPMPYLQAHASTSSADMALNKTRHDDKEHLTFSIPYNYTNTCSSFSVKGSIHIDLCPPWRRWFPVQVWFSHGLRYPWFHYRALPIWFTWASRCREVLSVSSKATRKCLDDWVSCHLPSCTQELRKCQVLHSIRTRCSASPLTHWSSTLRSHSGPVSRNVSSAGSFQTSLMASRIQVACGHEIRAWYSVSGSKPQNRALISLLQSSTPFVMLFWQSPLRHLPCKYVHLMRDFETPNKVPAWSFSCMPTAGRTGPFLLHVTEQLGDMHCEQWTCHSSHSSTL